MLRFYYFAQYEYFTFTLIVKVKKKKNEEVKELKVTVNLFEKNLYTHCDYISKLSETLIITLYKSTQYGTLSSLE